MAIQLYQLRRIVPGTVKKICALIGTWICLMLPTSVIGQTAQIEFIGEYSNVILGCNPTPSAINNALGSATATSECGIQNLVETMGPIVVAGCQRFQTIVFTATDGCGNTATVSRSVGWVFDITSPVFTGSYTTISLGTDPTPGEISGALGDANASDNCGGSPIISSSDSPVRRLACDRSQIRTFTATDACGNLSTVSRTVTWSVHSGPVFIGNYSSVSLGCNPTISDINTALGTAEAVDNCGLPINITIQSTTSSVSTNGCNNSQTRLFTATDEFGAIATIFRIVVWMTDAIAPDFIGTYSNTILGPDPSASDIEAALGTADASDNCAGLLVTSSDRPIQSNGCGRTQTRIFTAADGCSHTATVSRTVLWVVPGCGTNTMISIDDASVVESAGSVSIQVFLSQPSSTTVTVKYKTENGTAKQGKDYLSLSGEVTFYPGELAKNISVSIVIDNEPEPDENFFIRLSKPENAIIADEIATVAISETVAPINPKTNLGVESNPREGVQIKVANPQYRNSTLRIEGAAPGSFSLTIFDLHGRLITKIGSYRNNMPLSNLAAGIYIYQITYRSKENKVEKVTGKLLIRE
jgi:hypothetical protein